MSKNSGTLVIAQIRPNDSADTYPAFWANDGLGGHHQVDTTTTMYAIPDLRRQEGMMCFVTANALTYQLVGGTDNTNWQVFSGAADSYRLMSKTSNIETVSVDNTQGVNIFQTVSGNPVNYLSINLDYTDSIYGHVSITDPSGGGRNMNITAGAELNLTAGAGTARLISLGSGGLFMSSEDGPIDMTSQHDDDNITIQTSGSNSAVILRTTNSSNIILDSDSECDIESDYIYLGHASEGLIQSGVSGFNISTPNADSTMGITATGQINIQGTKRLALSVPTGDMTSAVTTGNQALTVGTGNITLQTITSGNVNLVSVNDVVLTTDMSHHVDISRNGAGAGLYGKLDTRWEDPNLGWQNVFNIEGAQYIPVILSTQSADLALWADNANMDLRAWFGNIILEVNVVGSGGTAANMELRGLYSYANNSDASTARGGNGFLYRNGDNICITHA